ncbi:hypothetical protein JCGZ_23711 [Jatropha curcas]|uniref:Uncharacterized protein n=1 Tax=Jatropha curcas TaxID=180498 RepID=A0A067JP83_JATCU|nr:hypothetical protein JCGZ_23711 [Jatropha curcas]
MEEMCPLFEEFCATIGCDPNAPLVKHEVKIGYVRSFESLFQFSRPQARAMIVGDQKAILLPLIGEFSEVHSDDPDRVWLKDHLQVVAAPTCLPYNPSQYGMRRILITHPSTDAWTSWLIELGPNEVLWFISWYDITRFIQVSFRHT